VHPGRSLARPAQLVQRDRQLRPVVVCVCQRLARRRLRFQAQGHGDRNEELRRERDRRVKEVVRGPVVRHFFEPEPRSVSERGNRPERIHVGRELAPIRSERRVAVQPVADRKIKRNGGHERHQMALREAVIEELLPRRPNLRDGPVGVAELDSGVAGEVELHTALLRHDPVVRQERSRPNHDPEFASAEIVVVLRGESEADRALLAVQDADEFPDLTVVFHLHGHGRHAVQVGDQIFGEDSVVPYEERADERLPNHFRQRRNLDSLLDVVPVPEEAHAIPPCRVRTRGRSDRGSASHAGGPPRSPGPPPSREAGSPGGRATGTSSRPRGSCLR